MAIPSVSGSEGEVGRVIGDELAARGYRVERQQVETERFNLIARNPGAPSTVVFCTHIDTVPPALPVSEDETFLYGRGACDTKGILATMLEAGDRLRQSGVSSFGYLFVVGEETDGAGARAANTLPWDSRYVIVGEPTENKLARAQKGTFVANLAVKGRAAHSGYPEYGVSAILGLWEVLSDCLKTDWGADPVLGPASFNVGVFQGGERANIVPGRASASVMIRTVESPAQTRDRIERIVAGRASLEVVAGADPQFLHVVEGFETTVVSFGSDAPYLGNLGKPLMLGPGSILDAHTASEKIRKDDMIEGAALYERLTKTLLA
ncbi:MAG TPA: M20/M25/M40 family metallo-hydrolase [Terriglobia bacterium]|nr:M20/M25/M40 family metallo-hydrolase [Terriglobia bacterium]